MNASIAPTPPKSSSTVPIRVKRSTSRKLSKLVHDLNKKSLGRAVTSDDVIAKALSLLDESHFAEIKMGTYSSEDRLEIEFKNFCKTRGAISKNEFLKRVLQAALPHLGLNHNH